MAISIMDIQFTDKAIKQLEKIEKSDRKIAQRIIGKIEEYSENIKGSYDIKTLKGRFGDRKRLRVSDYRVIFKIEESTMIISTIKHRQDVYND